VGGTVKFTWYVRRDVEPCPETGKIVEQDPPEQVFGRLQHEHTRVFLSAVLTLADTPPSSGHRPLIL
jgi:hypothetical protein